jgi:hypothetical protein
MATSNESPGLKIAVAAFITLSVILSITAYFLYNAYYAAQARLEVARTQNEFLIRSKKLLEIENADLKMQISKLSTGRPK